MVISGATKQNDCAFCEESTKFGTLVDYPDLDIGPSQIQPLMAVAANFQNGRQRLL